MTCEEFWNQILNHHDLNAMLEQDEALKAHIQQCATCRGEMAEANVLFRTAAAPTVDHLTALTKNICAAATEKKQKKQLWPIHWKPSLVFVPTAVAAIVLVALSLHQWNRDLSTEEENLLAVAPAMHSNINAYSSTQYDVQTSNVISDISQTVQSDASPDCIVQNMTEVTAQTTVADGTIDSDTWESLVEMTSAYTSSNSLPSVAYQFFQVDSIALSSDGEGEDGANEQMNSNDSLTASFVQCIELYDSGGF